MKNKQRTRRRSIAQRYSHYQTGNDLMRAFRWRIEMRARESARNLLAYFGEPNFGNDAVWFLPGYPNRPALNGALSTEKEHG